mgnify:CR=1 FL=1
MQSFWDLNSDYVKTALYEGRHITLMNIKKNQSILKNHVRPYFKEFYQNLKVKNVTEDILNQFFKSRLICKCKNYDRVLSTGFLKKIKTCLVTPLKWAETNRFISNKLDFNIIFPKLTSIEVYHRGILSVDEQIRLLNYDWRCSKAYLAFFVAINTGLRLGEIRALRIGDVQNDFIKVKRAYNDYDKVKTTKTGVTRTVPSSRLVYKRVQQYIKTLPKEFQDEKCYIFSSSKNPMEPIDENFCTRNFYRAMDELGIKRIRYNYESDKMESICFHSLRHQTATRWVSSGVDQRLIAKALGHSTYILQQRYSNHFDEKMMSELALELEEKGALGIDSYLML